MNGTANLPRSSRANWLRGASPVIAVVGPCGAGKTTLVTALRARGFSARQTLQEHSYVHDMWRRVAQPDVLIYLDASLETTRRRLKDATWPDWLRELQIHRLADALTHCDLYIDTDGLAPEEVLARVLEKIGAS